MISSLFDTIFGMVDSVGDLLILVFIVAAIIFACKDKNGSTRSSGSPKSSSSPKSTDGSN